MFLLLFLILASFVSNCTPLACTPCSVSSLIPNPSSLADKRCNRRKYLGFLEKGIVGIGIWGNNWVDYAHADDGGGSGGGNGGGSSSVGSLEKDGKVSDG
jgi:hypothetical protein